MQGALALFHTATEQLSAVVAALNFNAFVFESSSDYIVVYKQELTECRYGQEYASQTPRKYFKKVKNAQEAHEAIRPTDIRRLPCKQIIFVMYAVFFSF